MKKVLALLLMLALLPACAAALTVPEHVQSIGNDAFEGIGLGYIRLAGHSLVEGGGGVAFVIGPPDHPQAAVLENFVPEDEVLIREGFLYRSSEGRLTLLCPENRDVTGEVTIPKLVDGLPVAAVSSAALTGLSGVTLRLPAYLAEDTELACTAYETMAVVLEMPESGTVGETLTLRASAAGGWGGVQYAWTITPPGEDAVPIGSGEAEIALPLTEAGTWQVALTVTDAVGDHAAAQGHISVQKEDLGGTVYRAYLVGNTYPDSSDPLKGCDTDVAALRRMLASMTGTPYHVTTALNQTRNGILSGIRNAFAGADENDVSLFHFSGHGSYAAFNGMGYLMGTSGSISSQDLRRALDEVPGTKIVMLDCCHSGGFINRSADGDAGSPGQFVSDFVSAFSWSSQARGENDLAAGGYHVLVSSRKDQNSSTLSDGQNSFGVFTHGVCYGSGYDSWYQRKTELHADANGDGRLTVREVYQGTKQRVAEINDMLNGRLEQATQWYTEDANFIMWAQ